MPYQTYQSQIAVQNNNNCERQLLFEKQLAEYNLQAQLVNRQQQQQQQQKILQPTPYNYNLQQQQQSVRSNSINAATDINVPSCCCLLKDTTTPKATKIVTTNAKMSSLTSGNVLLQTNPQLLQHHHHQHQAYPQTTNYNEFYNNYLNNNNNNNYNNIYQQQMNTIGCLQQQQQQQQLFQDEQVKQKQQQYERRQQLQLPLTTTNNLQTSQQQFLFKTPEQQQQPQRQAQQQLFNKNFENNNNVEVATSNLNTANEKFTMDACEIANFLANELFMQQLVSMDGIQSGVPTLTTSTLTPTTLRSIEETFIQLTSDPVNAPYQAGFIPPPLAPLATSATTTGTLSAATAALFNGSGLPEFSDLTAHETESEEDGSQSSWNAPQFNEDNSLATTDNSSAATDTTSFQNGSNGLGGMLNSTSNASSTNDFSTVFAAASVIAKHGANTNNNNNNNMLNNNNLQTSNTSSGTTTRRHTGGRRPTKAANMSPEEEEKRRIRRERNKEAAARCRKRRVDQTNELLDEVGQLEKKGDTLKKEIEALTATKEELEYIMNAHKASCQKIRNDLLSVNTFGGLILPTTTTSNSNNNNNNNNNVTLSTTLTRSMSPIDIKPVILNDQILNFIKNEPLENPLDSNSSLEHDGPHSPKRRLLASSNNPMVPPPLPLPNVSSITASLNTPIVTTAPITFGSFTSNNATLHTLNALHHNKMGMVGGKPRPNSLPTNPRNAAQLALNVDGKPLTDINGVAIQTPSTGVFNFDSLMDGGTGLTPVSGPLVPTCSSQNKHPLELATPTSEPSKLVSL